MNPNASAPSVQIRPEIVGQVSAVLLQNWATMVDEQADQLGTARRQLRAIDQRATRMYNENVTLHGLFNESEAELHYHQQLNQRLSLLIGRILLENQELPSRYVHEYHSLIDGTEGNPIDLTTDEELDVEM